MSIYICPVVRGFFLQNGMAYGACLQYARISKVVGKHAAHPVVDEDGSG